MPYVDPKDVMIRGQQYTFVFASTGIPTLSTATPDQVLERLAPLGLAEVQVSNPSLASYSAQVTFKNTFVGKTVGDLGQEMARRMTGAWYERGSFTFLEANTGAPASTGTSQFQKYAVWGAIGVAAIAIGFGFIQGFARGAGAGAVGGT